MPAQQRWSADRELPPGSNRTSMDAHHEQYGDMPKIFHRERSSSHSILPGTDGKESGYITARKGNPPIDQQQQRPLDHYNKTGAQSSERCRSKTTPKTRETPGNLHRISERGNTSSPDGETSVCAQLPIRKLPPPPRPNRWPDRRVTFAAREADRSSTSTDKPGSSTVQEQFIRRPIPARAPHSFVTSDSIYGKSHDGEFL